ncbi:MAG: hypothetical protein DCF19_03735 [Pseudanabaena frigida]|uniref:Uncharacterized protein n=1 Tax=Pseudanabaena frigida TaxID=945775 RepID=A0A2W4Y8I5_9CYAN|nr:MAG: hypothetical protein DCF19_03735 [Pseudanabaena frigida]
MSKFEEMKDHLSNNFDNLNDVLEVELRESFSIIDHKGQSFIVLAINIKDNTFTIRVNGKDTVASDFDDTKLFNIINAKTVAFIPIDGKKGLLGFGDSYCDFVIFDDNDFFFVEFKLNATILEERAIRKNRKKAINQLKNTIALFDRKLNRNYNDLRLEAYVCTPETYPRGDKGWTDLAIAFYDEVEVPLFEHNEKICI